MKRSPRRQNDRRARPNLLVLEDRITPFAVSSLDPASLSAVQLPLATIDVNFDAPVSIASASPTDLVLSRGSVTGVSLLDADTLRFTINGPPTDDTPTLSVSIPAGALTDTGGIPNAAFAGSYQVDVGSIPFPVSLGARLPVGSLIYDATSTGRLATQADVDEYTFTLDPGQTLAVVADQDGFPSANLQPTIEVIGPDGSSLGFVTAAAIGAPANLLVQVEAGGIYRVRIGSAAGSGFYNLQAALNGAIESESFQGGPANNTLATAQNIDGSFIELSAGPSVIDRGGALGISDPGQQLIVNGSFEGSFTGWTTETTGLTYGDWTVATPQAGFFPLQPVEPQDGNWVALNAFDGFTPMEFRLYQDVAIPADAAAVSLTWKDRIQWDFTFGGGLAQARTYSVEVLDPTTGALLGTLHSFSTGSEATNPTGNTGWLTHSVELTAFAGQSVRLMFREVVPEGLAGPGSFELDAVSLAVAVPDHYSLTLSAGDRVSVAVDSQSTTGLPVDGVTMTVDLLDANGNVVASGVAGATNLDEVISNHPVAESGTYSLRVTSPTRIRYGLVVTRNAAFDTEANDTFGTAQPLGTSGALGAITAGTEVTPDVVPGGLADIEGQGSTLSLQGNTRIQQIISRTEFDGSSIIDAIRLRRDVFYPAFTSPITVILQINLGYAATTVETASPVFTDNIGAGYTSVFSGTLNVTSPGTGSPNPFDIVFDVADLFAYDPALGDLLVDYRITFAQAPPGFFIPVSLDASGNGQQFVTNTVRGGLNAANGLIGSFGPGSPPLGLVTQFDLVPAQTDDWYSVEVSDTANPLQFNTATPSDGLGQFGNALDPKIELYDPNGNLVASGVVGPDGRNETLTHTPLVAGNYRVRVIGEGGTRGEYVLTQNSAPVAGPVAGPTPSPGVRGQTLHFSGSFTDADRLDAHEVSWDFGDGTVTPFAPASAAALAPSHVYTEAGEYTVTFRVRDVAGAGASASTTATVQVVALQDDPLNPGTTALAVGGTTGNDVIAFARVGNDGAVAVFLNGTSLGAFHPTGRLIAFGQAGHDAILADGSINAAAWFYGGAGNDLLKGGRGPNVLLGGAGQDALMGGSGRDILIGGFGFDLLVGGGGDDLMIGGKTAFDDDEESLDAIQAEWTSSRDAATRRANLSGTGAGERLNGEVFLTPSTVFDDGDGDLLIGASGDDWLLLGDDDLGL